MPSELSFDIRLAKPYDQAVDMCISALKDEGFGVLTKIDVQATIKEKLGHDFRPYVILGTCNPPLAHRALFADPTIGMMLPCNVTIEAEDQSSSIIRIVNPEMMMGVGNYETNPEIQDVAESAKEKLLRVAQKLQS